MANPQAAGQIELVKTDKRDYLIGLEKKYQSQWSDSRIFEVDAPAPDDHSNHTKWMGTFPYPYMNGSLHLGHGFTISKIEFGAGYQRMLGKKVLFPVGMHCTGMPIKASADKLIREIEMFGPDFEGYSEDGPAPTSTTGTASSAPAASGAVDKAKKGKVAAKATGLTYQFQIMESIGVPRAEIKKFADPLHWLTYFPPITKEDCTALGARVDWRRSFITTAANPYYDSFVRWQMNKLHKLNKIKFGERYTIYSPKDGQPCMDHDRQSGEGVGPQEYTGLKIEVLEWSELAKEELGTRFDGKKVFLVAATLRTETVYGQTGCYVSPTIKYGFFTGKNDEIYVCTYRAARNMTFQGILEPAGQVNQLAEIDGAKLLGTKIRPPWSLTPEVYVLPMENVLATKGTGVVTSAPSDSPDDYQTLLDLRKKPEFYKIDPLWASTDPTPMIEVPGYGTLIAPALIKQLKIQSQKDVKQLAEAKEIAYREGFYKGKMIVGECAGMRVEDAKPVIRAALIKEGLAFAYSEPEGVVMSRSQDECVVALVDQWYLDYGEAGWKAQAEKLLSGMNTYSTETRHGFEATLNWLNQWACARSYGLGSKLPWDPQFLVESLSDSTIYMSYYTVSHLLHGGSFDGSTVGPLGITADQMTDEAWEYVLGDATTIPSDSPVSKDKLDTLKNEFSFFYPMDIRSSGKDLIPNHLTFAIYNHAALFPEKYWPKSMRANGHLLLNGKKMSKSTGNSMTLRDSVEKFGADATRLALADAGDGIEDANFEDKTANAAILRLYTLIEWCEEMLGQRDTKAILRPSSAPRDSYHDKIFENEINHAIVATKAAYEATNYKEALQYGFYELQAARDWYREVTSDIGMHAGLIEYFIRTLALLALPIIPHFSEHIWSTLLKEKDTVQNALFPEPTFAPEQSVIDAGNHMKTVVKTIRDAELNLLKKSGKGGGAKGGKKGGAPAFDPNAKKAVNVFVASKFPEWQEGGIDVLRQCTDMQTSVVDDAKLKELMASTGLIKDKKVMPFVQNVKKRINQFGAPVALNRTLPFSEIEALKTILPYIQRTMNFSDGEVMTVEDARTRAAGGDVPGITLTSVETAEPGSPAFVFWNV